MVRGFKSPSLVLGPSSRAQHGVLEATFDRHADFIYFTCNIIFDKWPDN